MNKKTKTRPQRQSVFDRWTTTARGAATVKEARQGQPKGELDMIVRMEADWSRIPNTLFEDATGQLWLAFTKERTPNEAKPEGELEAATVEEALEWMQHVLEFCDGWDGDPADICRLSLREIRSRPSDLERVAKAMREEVKAGWKPRRKAA